MKVVSPRIAVGLVGVGFAFPISSVWANGPSIAFTNVPAYGAQGNLNGLVSNADFTTNAVAVYIYVAGVWYSKPSCAGALTPIQPDGSWTADITTSPSDANATEIAVFLVPSNYTNACVNGASGLPIPPEAEAVAYTVRVNPSARQINFAGYGWSVRNSSGLVGPGPNYFSDSTNNVWVDAQGALHMKITHTNNTWQCAEVVNDRTLGYGQYRFTVSAPVSSLDPSVVLGLFTYCNDNVYNYREIDVELSRWGNAANANDAQFVVQPSAPTRKLRFQVPDGVTNSAYSFVWQTNRVDFQSLNGDFTVSPAPTNVIQTWTCTNGVPLAGGETARINLWLYLGTPPTDNQEAEVVISNFEFVPLGLPQRAQLSNVTLLSDGAVKLEVQGQTDWRYQIESSTNLLDWADIGSVLSTNDVFYFLDRNTNGFDNRFYRVVTEP